MKPLNTFYNQDCVLGMQELGAETVDLVVTSPPYDNLREYNNSSSWCWDTFTRVADELITCLKPGGVIAWNVADSIVPLHKKRKGEKKASTSMSGTSFKQCLYFMDNGLNFHDNLLYQKHSARFCAGDHSLRHSNIYEYVFILSKGRPKSIHLIRDKPNKCAGQSFWKSGGRNTDGTILGRDKTKEKQVTPEFGIRTNIWLSHNVHKDNRLYGHPALMPPPLVEDLITTYSEPDDVVLDPFMGSGTTARAAIAKNRQWIGFEIDKTYYELAKECTSTTLPL